MTPFSGPVFFETYEIVFMRLGFAMVLIGSAFPRQVNFANQPNPVGLARFVNLTFLSNQKLYRLLRWVALLSLPLYVAGWAMGFVLPYLCLLTTGIWALRNSQGAVVHAKQLLAMILLVQSVIYVFELYNSLFNPDFEFPSGANYDQLAIYWTQQAIVAVYFTSALSKLYKSRFLWIKNVVRIPLQMVKTCEQRYHNELDPAHRKRVDVMADWLVRHPGCTRAILGTGLILEILSPLALVNRPSMIGAGIGLWAFHKGNTLFMNLHFHETQRLLLIFFVNVPYLVYTFYQSYLQ